MGCWTMGVVNHELPAGIGHPTADRLCTFGKMQKRGTRAFRVWDARNSIIYHLLYTNELGPGE